MKLGLEGKNVLITGGSKGIGKACALLFAEEGANLALAARSADTLEEAAAEVSKVGPGEVFTFTGDMTQWEDVKRVADSLERGAGFVVLVVGNDGVKPTYWETTAGAANAAGINVASSMAEQYGPYGIRVNTVNPGPVDPDRWDGLEKAMARDMGITQEQAHDFAVSSIPLGRIARADEVADLVVFLASERASFINGSHVVIDGAQRKAKMDRDTGR